MHAKDSKGKVGIEYTSKPLSGWGGLVSLVEWMDRLEVRRMLREALPDGRTSPNQVDVVDTVMGLWLTATTGGTRFSHVERLRGDEALRVIAGVDRFPSDSVLTRYFSNFTPSQNEGLHAALSGTFESRLQSEAEDILDLDSTTLTRYGKQQGSAKGYHPTRPGQYSHQPLLAMMAGTKMIVHSWLRSGNSSTLKGAAEFIRETVARLPKGFKISCVRADSGFISDNILTTLEELKLDYVIAAKMTQPLGRYCSGLTEWTRISPNIEIASGLFQPLKWKTARRVVVIRRSVGEPSPLFGVISYEFDALFTSLDSSPDQVWKTYRGRGDCENRIKELKHDFGVTGFCLQSFIGTEVVFRLICALHNILVEFKRIVLEDASMTLGTIRHRLFVMGASIGCSARKVILRLGLLPRWSKAFERLRARIAAFDPTTPPPSQVSEPSSHALRWQLRRSPLPVAIN